jgi:hypothetical protein
VSEGAAPRSKWRGRDYLWSDVDAEQLAPTAPSASPLTGATELPTNTETGDGRGALALALANPLIANVLHVGKVAGWEEGRCCSESEMKASKAPAPLKSTSTWRSTIPPPHTLTDSVHPANITHNEIGLLPPSDVPSNVRADDIVAAGPHARLCTFLRPKATLLFDPPDLPRQ